ncbi:patatin-like phospholipase family protein [Mesorhizobium sp. ORM6]
MLLNFVDIFRRELSVINFRRMRIRGGAVAEHRSPADSQSTRHFLVDRGEAALDDARSDPQQGTVRTKKASNLTGIALSGGGMRSASYCLGVLQALESLAPAGSPRPLDAVDYLSTVSGGGYIGTSVVAGMMQDNRTFPFESRLDQAETPETQHLRDFSSFLAPEGAADYLVGIALVMRGLLVNALIVLPALLLLAVLTIAINPTVADLVRPGIFGISAAKLPVLGETMRYFAHTVVLAALAALLMFGSALYTSLTFRTGTLKSREILGRALGVLVAVVFFSAIVDLQPLVLSGMLANANDKVISSTEQTFVLAEPFQDFLSAFASILPSLATVLVPTVAVLISVSQKLAKLAEAAFGDVSWSATIKKNGSRLVLYLAAVIVPFMLWVTYIYLSYWAIRKGDEWCGVETPRWLKIATQCEADWYIGPLSRLGPIGATYLGVALVLSLVCLLIGPNSNSLHRLYRDRLSRAFLMQRSTIGQQPSQSVDAWTFSSLKPVDEAGHWEEGAAFSPYLLSNAAINLEGSKALNKRGRNADNFIFSPLHVGSQSTHYVSSTDIEAVVPDLSLATAMATSGAAASANMGRQTVKILTFSLSLLNIRLGYWLANPFKIEAFKNRLNRWIANVGTLYFAAETAGLLNENRLNVYLTDGGHIENLGIYELLRRRCKVILAVDAEADPALTFPSLVNLEVMARIDLGVRIDLGWQAIQAGALAITPTAPYGPDGPPGRHGPHAAIGIIRYDDDETGTLIYIKSSLSGDENDYIIDYFRRHPTFPHETTVDQFFTEEQFEAYRALGFHAARGLLTGADDFGNPVEPPANWDSQLAEALALLNVPDKMAAATAARI